MEYTEKIANLKAEFKIGLHKTSDLNKVLKLLDKLGSLIKETRINYNSLDIDYFLKLEKTFFIIDDNYRDNEEHDKTKAIKELQDFTIGIIYNDNLITNENITEKLKEMLDKEENQRVLTNIHSNFSDFKGTDYLQFLIKIIRNESEDERAFRSIRNSHFKKEITEDLGLKKVIKIFFNEDINPDKLKASEKIVKVFEKDNLRCVLSVSYSNWNNQKNYELLFALPEWEYYNYLDEGRFYVNDVISDFELSRKETNFLKDEKTYLLRNLRNKGRIDLDDVFYSASEEIKSSQKAHERKKILKNREKEEQYEVEESIKKLLDKKGNITLNGIKREKEGYFEYQDNRIGYKGFNVLEIENEENDFNEIFNKIVWDYLHIHNRSVSEVSLGLEPLECGNFNITIKTKISKDGSSRYYVEGIRINKNEREDVIKRAICYQKKKDFKSFLKEVSRCSIKIHNVLSTGLTYSIKEDVYTNVQLIREANYHFIVFEKSKYRISNINSLINLQSRGGYYHSDFNAHSLAECLEKNSLLNYEKAIEVIKEGLKGYKEAIKRAKELLKNTISQLKISELEVDNNEYNGKGYLVRGKSGKQYFITDNLKIYEYPNFRYVCVIDKSPIKLNRTDLLISRMYALSNDSMIADQVYTLKTN